MAGPSSKKSIEDLENQLILKNKDLNEKFLELETLLDLTNTINSLDDLDSLFFNDTATTEIYTSLFVGSVRCV